MAKSVVGPWAAEKLEGLGKYLNAYTTIMRRCEWCKGYWYIDAFAGPGIHEVRTKRPRSAISEAVIDLANDVVNDADHQEFLSGSPRVALEIEHPFTGYVFVDKSPHRIGELKKLKDEFKGTRKIAIRQADCNKFLKESVVNSPRVDWSVNRAVVFLDPFGMQVPWDTIEALGKTGSIEIFLNFPVGMAIQRLLLRRGRFTSVQRKRLDDYFGSSEWYNILYRQEPNLFGETDHIKIAHSGETLVKWYRRRLKQAFGHASRAC